MRVAAHEQVLRDSKRVSFCDPAHAGVQGPRSPARCPRGRPAEPCPWCWFCCRRLPRRRAPVPTLAPATFPARSTARSAPWLPCQRGFLNMWKESIWGLYHILLGRFRLLCLRVYLVSHVPSSCIHVAANVDSFMCRFVQHCVLPRGQSRPFGRLSERVHQP